MGYPGPALRYLTSLSLSFLVCKLEKQPSPGRDGPGKIRVRPGRRVGWACRSQSSPILKETDPRVFPDREPNSQQLFIAAFPCG